ncbi:hypothetical protein [Pediococcus ethanolidurans]
MSDWLLIIPLALFGVCIFVYILTIGDTKPKKYKKYAMRDVDNNLQLFVETLSYDEEMHIMMNWYLLNYQKRSISEANSFALGKMIDDDDGNTKYFLKQLLHYNRTL